MPVASGVIASIRVHAPARLSGNPAGTDRKDDAMSPKDTQEQSNAPAESAEAQQPEGSKPEEQQQPEVKPSPEVKPPKPEAVLAAHATEYLDRDKVTPSQARAYTQLLGEEPLSFSVLSNYDRETLEKIARKEAAMSREDASAFRQAYSGLTPSHQWLKAIIATALAIEDAKLAQIKEVEEGVTPTEEQDEIAVS